MARGEVVATIQYQVGQADLFIQGLAIQSGHQRINAYLGVDVMQGLLAGLGLGCAHTRRVVQNLSLKVTEVYDIIVRKNDMPNTGRRQVQGSRRTQASGTYNQDPAGMQPLLSFDPELIKQNMPRVTQQLLIVHCAGIKPSGVIRYRSTPLAGLSGFFFSAAASSVLDSGLAWSVAWSVAWASVLAATSDGSLRLTARPSRRLMACLSW